jgi:flagellar hook-associated protein 2
MQRIDAYDFFDIDSEERGVLLNNPTTTLVRSALVRTAQQRAEGVDTQYQFLRQVGITIGKNSNLEFDESEFRAALDNDLEAVENLIAAFESTPAPITEIEPGVTVVESDDVITSRGLGEIFSGLLDELTNSVDGVVTLADRNFDELIDITNDRIEVIDSRLASRREQLERQFAAMETALVRIQGQGQALASLAGNLALLQQSTSGLLG